VTGTTHLAAALGVPTFCFYAGYTNTVWHPPGPIHRGVSSKSWTSCRDISVEEAYSTLVSDLTFVSGLK
jgi:ADP-heptose:LPS heptosyltransferase